jgi:phenylalanyl-tRNA synthetase beta chain
MKISYNWLSKYIKTDLNINQISEILTDIGLEVEVVEKFESLKGGLEGIVIGEVLEKSQHPNADKLSLTKVHVGNNVILPIVCGAPNVAAGQKVVVATENAVLYPVNGESFTIKKAKIRGEESIGMICAEDEIGLGESHAGIIILPSHVEVGTPAAKYFDIYVDYIFEIGLTPNRSDAISHYGVARDLAAAINSRNIAKAELLLPNVEAFKANNSEGTSIEVKDVANCPRYSGINISNITVAESPAWLKNNLKAIGLKPINNIVDITNYVMHEIGQPLHAFDTDKITGNKVIVRPALESEVFITLDEVERKMLSSNLMIANEKEGMCVAGVFGGIKSGIKNETKNVFLESAYFNPVSIRKTSKYLGLKTDASFRYERTTDPEITIFALKRAALLMQEIAGGEISSSLKDIYPVKIEQKEVLLHLKNVEKIIGKRIEKEQIKTILSNLEIVVVKEEEDRFLLNIPTFKADVNREIDVIEEIARIYGYNNIEIPEKLVGTIAYAQKPDKEYVLNEMANILSHSGFNEMMNNSLTKAQNNIGVKESLVQIQNPLSSDLNVMRNNLLFSGLEVIKRNTNHKRADLKLFEIGKTYHFDNEKEGFKKFSEKESLSLFVTGKDLEKSWFNLKEQSSNFFILKNHVYNLIRRFVGVSTKIEEESIENNADFDFGLSININKRNLVNLGKVNAQLLKKADLDQEVFAAVFDITAFLNIINTQKITAKEIIKFPAVKRDLAMLVDKEISFKQIKEVAQKTENQLLKSIHIFDIYEGKNIEQGKKSYAVSFVLQDENKTLTDAAIEKTMSKLQEQLSKQLKAEVRS